MARKKGIKMSLSEFQEYIRREPSNRDPPPDPPPPPVVRKRPPKGGFKSDDCAICLESLKVVTTKCGHKFHASCLSDAHLVDQERKCPVCRSKKNGSS